jgi:hypothetical protein
MDVKPIDIKKDDLCMKEYVFYIVRHHMNQNGNSVRKVSEKLCLTKRTIYTYLKEMEAIGI